MTVKNSDNTCSKLEVSFDTNYLILRCLASKKPKKIESRALLCSAIHQVLSFQEILPKSLVVISKEADYQADDLSLLQYLDQRFPQLKSSIFYACNSVSLLSCLDDVKEPTLLLVYSDSSSQDFVVHPPLVKSLLQTKRSGLLNFLNSTLENDKETKSGIFINRPMVIQKSKGKALAWQALNSPLQISSHEAEKIGSKKETPEILPSQSSSFGFACTVIKPPMARLHGNPTHGIEFLSFFDNLRGLSLQSLSNIADTCSQFIGSKIDLDLNVRLRISISSAFPALVAGLGLALKNCLPAPTNLYFYADDLQLGPSQQLSLVTFLFQKNKDEVGFHIDLNRYPKVTCISNV